MTSCAYRASFGDHSSVSEDPRDALVSLASQIRGLPLDQVRLLLTSGTQLDLKEDPNVLFYTIQYGQYSSRGIDLQTCKRRLLDKLHKDVAVEELKNLKERKAPCTFSSLLNSTTIDFDPLPNGVWIAEHGTDIVYGATQHIALEKIHAITVKKYQANPESLKNSEHIRIYKEGTHRDTQLVGCVY